MNKTTEEVLRQVIDGDPYHKQFTPLLDEIDRLREKIVGLNNTVIALSEESRMMRKEFSEVRMERDTYKQRYLAFADMPSTPSSISEEEEEPSAAAGLTDRVMDILNNTTGTTEPLPPIREVMDTMMNTISEPEVITELRKRVAKANELSKFNREIGFENRGNHVLGAFLTGVLREYDKVVGDVKEYKYLYSEYKLFYEDMKTSYSYLHRVIDDIATVLGYRMAQTYEPQLLVKKVKKLVEANRGISG